jgi:hypothetical protein
MGSRATSSVGVSGTRPKKSSLTPDRAETGTNGGHPGSASKPEASEKGSPPQPHLAGIFETHHATPPQARGDAAQQEPDGGANRGSGLGLLGHLLGALRAAL